MKIFVRVKYLMFCLEVNYLTGVPWGLNYSEGCSSSLIRSLHTK